MARLSVVSALVCVVMLSTSSSQAASNEELQARLDTLKRKEAAAAAEIAALRKRIRTLEASHPPTHASSARPAAIEKLQGQSALAADMTAKAPTVPPFTSSWEGLYVGAGYSRNKATMRQGTSSLVVDNGAPVTNQSLNLDQAGFFNGGHVLGGYLWQFNRFLIGLEGDYALEGEQTWSSPNFLDGCTPGVTVSGTFGCATASAFGTFETKGHLRGIVGVEVTPQLMGFVAGGVAFGQMRSAGVHLSAAVADSPSAPDFAAVDSNYRDKTLVGVSIGGGFQAKLSNGLIGRIEYVHDRFETAAPASASVAATAGASTHSATTNPSKLKFTNDSLRASLIYRFDPTMSVYEAAARDWAAMTWAPAQRNAWAGFYVGGGINQNNYTMTLPRSATISINDSNTPGLDFQRAWDLQKSGQNTAAHVIMGARVQWNRFLLGIEGDWTGGSKMAFSDPSTIGQFAGPGNPLTCYNQFSPNVVCVGHHIRGGGIETTGRLRYTAGLEITPSLMAFFTAGKAYGNASFAGVGVAGIVANPGNPPLVGAATVTRAQSGNVTGRTIGGGVEFKLADNVSVRGEYLRDTYTYDLLPVGGAGFGGTTGNITVNSFASTAANKVEFTNEVYRASLVIRMFNPQEFF